MTVLSSDAMDAICRSPGPLCLDVGEVGGFEVRESEGFNDVCTLVIVIKDCLWPTRVL